MSTTKKFLALLLICTGLTMLSGCGHARLDYRATAVVRTTPTNLTGDWHQVQNGVPNTTMHAVVSKDSIQITVDMNSGDGSPFTALYWQGTFDPNSAGSQTSKYDQKAMEDSIIASEDTTKTFTTNAAGDIVYPFSILGMSTTVELARGAS